MRTSPDVFCHYSLVGVGNLLHGHTPKSVNTKIGNPDSKCVIMNNAKILSFKSEGGFWYRQQEQGHTPLMIRGQSETWT